MLLTPIKAIRAKCVDCCCGNVAEVRRCPATHCTLYPYRMGKRPKGYTDTPDVEMIVDSLASPHIFTAEVKVESSPA